MVVMEITVHPRAMKELHSFCLVQCFCDAMSVSVHVSQEHGVQSCVF